jgi:hypothetical protein
VVWIPPGEKHWHGATPTTAMTHVAIQEQLDGKAVDWMERSAMNNMSVPTVFDGETFSEMTDNVQDPRSDVEASGSGGAELWTRSWAPYCLKHKDLSRRCVGQRLCCWAGSEK